MAVRGFVRGLLWGSLAAAGGLVVVSQIAGPVAPPEDVAQPADRPAELAQTDTPEAESAATDAPDLAEAAGDAPAAPTEGSPSADGATPDAAPSAESAPPQTPDGATVATDAPAVPAPADTPPAQAATEAPSAPVADPPVAVAPEPVEPPAPPPSDAPAERMASAGQVSEPPDAPATGDAPQSTTVPDTPGLPVAEGGPGPVDLPPPPPLSPEEEALLLPLPQDPPTTPEPTEPDLPDPTPEPMAPPEPEPEGDAEGGSVATGQGTLAPAPSLPDQVPGVVTGRLPRIGAEPAAEAPDAAPDADVDAPPLRRFARPFDNTDQKPLFAILLQDDGAEGINRAELAALELPLSIVIDPLSEGAAERAAIWRAGGQEVVMAGTGIPVGASPGDLEQSFQVLATRLPEAVAVIDPDGRAFQNDRPLATQVVPILTAQGRGLVTFDQGLNAADQVARREGLAAATIFRSIDAEGEDSPVIRRYLDRAAFKAAQEGRVIVIGTLRPETVAGVLEWAVEGRASTVALAPVSAMLQGN